MTLGFTYDLRGYLSRNWEFLLDGLERTLVVSFIAIAGAFVIGLVCGALRAHRIPVLSQLSAVYVEVIRNTPILVQIFFVYFGLAQPIGPWPGIRLDVFDAAWISIMVWGGAFNTENFRAGFEAVPHNFREGAFALGFSRIGTFLNVTLPIGGRIALPSSINTYIAVLKNTALLYVIAFEEFYTSAYQINAIELATWETVTVLAVVYLTLVWSLSAGIRWLEGHLALPEAG